MISNLIQYFKDVYFTRQCKKQQRRWTKTIEIPEGTEFCLLIYNECFHKNNDMNCFLTKAPGCYSFRKYLQGENPKALVTQEYCLEYLVNKNIEKTKCKKK